MSGHCYTCIKLMYWYIFSLLKCRMVLRLPSYSSILCIPNSAFCVVLRITSSGMEEQLARRWSSLHPNNDMYPCDVVLILYILYFSI